MVILSYSFVSENDQAVMTMHKYLVQQALAHTWAGSQVKFSGCILVTFC